MRCLRAFLPFLFLLNLAPARSDSLSSLLASEWEALLDDRPVLATYVGAPGRNHRWPDLSPRARARRLSHYRELLTRLERFEITSLTPRERLDLQLFREQVGWQVRRLELGLDRLALNQREGIQTAAGLADVVPLETVQDYQDWVSRLESFPNYADATIELLRQGVEEQILLPRVIVDRLPAQIERQMPADPTESPYYKPFLERPEAFDGEVFDRLAQRAQVAIEKGIVPAYGRLKAFIESDYRPAAPETVGASQWPNGREAYQFLIERYTTTKMTADEIHQLGLAEVSRIRAEMEKVQQAVGFEGSLKEFFEHLRSDPQFYYQDPEELLEAYRSFCKKVDGQMPRLFGRLARLPYGVEPIPDYIAPDTTTAYYMPPAGHQAGIYFVNLYQPASRPIYEIPVLSLHEAVPGHHHQIALTQEMESLPSFRRYVDGFGDYTVFVEGWALYSESLGEEMGFYHDPYAKFGQLTYDMWRAVRLVLDTGLHSKGWTRAQAIDYFLDNTPKSRLDIVNEVDRYIAWPGQALAYKIGQLRIQELRGRAEQELGPRFRLADFHDTVLGQGAVSLEVLEQQVEAWLADQLR